MSDSVGLAFQADLQRVRDLLVVYKQLGPAGMFGAVMIRSVIEQAERAQASGDVVAIVRAFAALKGCE